MSAAEKTPERKAWEEANPREAHQEFELNDYITRLSSALHIQESAGDQEEADEEVTTAASSKSPFNDVTPSEWEEAERQMKSLERYCKEHRILAARVKETQIDMFLKRVLQDFKKLDETGIDREKVDVERVERIWGLADMIGSALVYLLMVDKRRSKGSNETEHTTRSIFLLKSAPPAPFKFTASKDEWRTKQLKEIKQFFDDYILVDNLKVDDERVWGSAFRELSRLEDMLTKGFAPENIKDSGIATTLEHVSGKIRVLEEKRAGKEVGDLSLMYVSWELALRIGAYFEEVVI